MRHSITDVRHILWPARTKANKTCEILSSDVNGQRWLILQVKQVKRYKSINLLSMSMDLYNIY